MVSPLPLYDPQFNPPPDPLAGVPVADHESCQLTLLNPLAPSVLSNDAPKLPLAEACIVSGFVTLPTDPLAVLMPAPLALVDHEPVTEPDVVPVVA